VVYQRGRGHSVVLIYVDDLIITGIKEAEMEAFNAQMKATFQLSNLGLIYFYLGIESTRTTAASLFIKLSTPSTSSS
jgi:hypothetical protein